MSKTDINSPDFSQIKSKDLKTRPFTTNGDYRVSISRKAHKAIREHAGENTTLELCGVLIGEIYKDDAGPYLEITDIIRGEHAENQGVQVTFTHETWSHISEIKDAEYADQHIVGWYHTHPSFGIFLSDQDLFIHNNFFNQPWQVAFVIDPINSTEGFFIWDDGVPSCVDYFWVEGQKRKSFQQPKVVKMETVKSDSRDSNTAPPNQEELNIAQPFYFYVFMIGAIALMFLYLIYSNYKLDQQISMQNEIIGNMFFRQARIADLILKHDNRTHSGQFQSNIEEARNKLEEYLKKTKIPVTFTNQLGHLKVSGRVCTTYQLEQLSKLILSIEGILSADIKGVEVTHRYITSDGDTLEEIAEKIYGSTSKWQKISEANKESLKDISSTASLKPELTLTLPEEE